MLLLLQFIVILQIFFPKMDEKFKELNYELNC